MSAGVALKFGEGAMQGTVRFVNMERRFGFITRDDGDDVFVHISGFVDKAAPDALLEGTRVEFDISTNPKTGKPCAVNVQVVQ